MTCGNDLRREERLDPATPNQRGAFSTSIRRVNECDHADPPLEWRDADGRPAAAHGFRRSIRTWVDDERPEDGAAAERALAHEEANKVSAACLGGDLLARRIALIRAGRHPASRAGRRVLRAPADPNPAHGVGSHEGGYERRYHRRWPRPVSGDWPTDPINNGSPLSDLESETSALAALAATVVHMSHGGDVTAEAIGYVSDQIHRHARRVQHLYARLAAADRARLETRIPPNPENPILLKLLRDRLLRAAGEVHDALGAAPKVGEP